MFCGYDRVVFTRRIKGVVVMYKKLLLYIFTIFSCALLISCETESSKQEEVEPDCSCFLCGIYGIEDYMVRLELEYDTYFFCTNCMTSYFKNIDTMKFCYYCISCGELTLCNDYIHWSGFVLCENCVGEYVKCKQCERYAEETRNGICGMCGDF